MYYRRADEKAEKPRPPSEPPVPDAATKRLKTLGTMTIQASFLLAKKRQASAGLMRKVAAQLQAEMAAAAEATEVARHDACASRMSPRRWKWAATSRCWS